MMEAGDQLAVTCPACSPGTETVHEVLAPGGQPTVRCGACGHVHATSVDSAVPRRSVRTVVSQGGDAVTAAVDVPEDAILEIGDRFVVEDDEAVYSVELTGLEDRQGRRQDRLEAADIETLWTRDIGNVSVNVTINPPRRSDHQSRSASWRLPGDEMVAVGDEVTIDGEPVRVTAIRLRETAVEAGAERTRDRSGTSAPAMELERVYARSRRRVRRDPW